MIAYIKTNEDSDKKAGLINILSPKIGYQAAHNIVDLWFDNYDEFVIHQDIGIMLMFKSRIKGDWTITENLNEYRYNPK